MKAFLLVKLTFTVWWPSHSFILPFLPYWLIVTERNTCMHDTILTTPRLWLSWHP